MPEAESVDGVVKAEVGRKHEQSPPSAPTPASGMQSRVPRPPRQRRHGGQHLAPHTRPAQADLGAQPQTAVTTLTFLAPELPQY